MFYNRLVFFLLFTLVCSIGEAQVTIGSSFTPNKGSLLDLKKRQPLSSDLDQTTSDKGLGMPRVALVDLSQLKPMYSYLGAENTPDEIAKEEHVGLMVYNVNEDFCMTTPISKGLYVWMGNHWQILNDDISNAEVKIFHDQEGNNFKARAFGNAGIWMIENLAVKSYPNHMPIDVFDGTTVSPPAKGMYSYPRGTASDWSNPPSGWDRRQGLLYNWTAVTNNYDPGDIDQAQIAGSTPGPNEVETVLEDSPGAKNGKIQGICPVGWHLPSDREWNALEKELYDNPSKYSSYTASEINSFNPSTWQTAWETATGKRPAIGNPGQAAIMKSSCQLTGTATVSGGKSLPVVQGGFEAFLVGVINGTSLFYGNNAFFWTSSVRAQNSAWQRNMISSDHSVARSVGSKNVLFSVRCKKD